MSQTRLTGLALRHIHLNFTQFVNRRVKILGRRLYPPSLKDVAWLEDVQKFGWVDEVRGEENCRQILRHLLRLL